MSKVDLDGKASQRAIGVGAAPVLDGADPSRPKTRLAALREDRLSIAILCFSLLTIIGVWLALEMQIASDRKSKINEVMRENMNLARAFEEHTARTLGYVNSVALAIQKQYEAQGKRLNLKTLFKELQPNLAVLHTVVITDEAGLVVLGTIPIPNPRVSLADREHIRAHFKADSNQLLISKPVLARVNKQWSVIATRRANKPDGSLAGVVAIALEPSYFSNFYRDLDLGKQGIVTLVGLDGVVRTRLAQDSAELGQDISEAASFKKLAGTPASAAVDSDTYISRSAVDMVERIYASRRMHDYPLIVYVGTGFDESMAPVFAEAHTQRVVTTILSAFIFAFSLLLVNFNLRRTQSQLRISALKDRQSAIIDSSMNAIIGVDESERVVVFSLAAENLFGIKASEAIGHTVERFIPQRFREGHHAHMKQFMHSGVSQRQMGQPAPLKALRSDGSEFSIEATIAHISTGGERLFMVTIRDISEREAADEKIKRLAFYDPLTHLPNRRLLMDRLGIAMATSARSRRNGSLLFVDLDNFKTLNDTLGHDKGDMLLEQVAQRLSTCIRDGDTVARLGGDEFVVMLEDLRENALEACTQAEVVGEKILGALSRPYQLGKYEHHCTVSIGVTLFGEQAAELIDEPLKRADLAMYQAKAAGRNTLRFFDPKMQAVVSARVELEAGLREALASGQFVLHYQAQVTDAGQCTGAEALVRWVHPAQGLVSPVDFIPLAEDTGLILPLGLWVLESACAQLALWAHRPDMAHLSVAVNVSPRQFQQPGFVEQVLGVLQRTGADPKRIKLELTEGLLIFNIDDVIAKMTVLKKAGVGFALDDFGTGFSSLSYLKQLPLDQLKIDQSFVRDILVDPNDAAIAKMVIVLADSLGLDVIAEGVETEAQRSFLFDRGCHAYQGYLFSHPLPTDEFESYVTRL